MLRPPFKVRRSRLPALTLLWLLGPSPLPLRAEDDSRLFEVVVNGRTTQLQAEFVQRGERLAALPDDLRALGLQTQGVPTGLDGRIMLDDIPGLKFQLEERTQTLRIKIPDTGLLANQISASPSKVTMSTAASDFGLVTNYNVLATRAQGRTLASGLLDERFNTPWGIIGRAGWLLQTGSPTRTLARLDTSLALTEPDSLRRWQVGDIITAGLSWTRPYRIGGLQVTSDFAPRPDLVTYPIPVVSGRADVPSTVDLFVNSVRQASQPVDQGPFQIRQPPVLTGANDVAVVVRDVTVCFTDFVGFTLSSEKLPPDRLVDALNEYFTAFDEISARYGMEKLKTIGDSYMFARGMGRPLANIYESPMVFSFSIP